MLLEGPICNPCFDAAVRVFGTCPGCGVERLLPGLSVDRAACRDCAGIARSFTCRRCGTEARLYYRKVCVRCRLDDLAAERLDDGTGTIRPELRPLVPVLARGFKSTPEGRLDWLKRPETRALLHALATGKVGLSHTAFDDLAATALVDTTRDLLVAAGCLPPIDRPLHRFERWLTTRLTQLQDHPYERVLRQFGTWHHLAKMRAKAAKQPLTTNAQTYASMEIKRAIDFCTWLADEEILLGRVPQAALDRYYRRLTAAHRQALCGFLNWAMTTKRMPRLTFARPRYKVGEALTQDARWALLRDLLHADDKPLSDRVAGCLLLLYAQPIPRILSLEISDVIQDGDDVLLRLGEPPSPVPEPFASLLLQHVADRTAADGDQWLFTGRRPGRALNYQSMRDHLRALGIPLRLARVGAARDLVLDIPAPVMAAALGFHHTTANRQVRNVGGTWNRYVSTRI